MLQKFSRSIAQDDRTPPLIFDFGKVYSTHPGNNSAVGQGEEIPYVDVPFSCR